MRKPAEWIWHQTRALFNRSLKLVMRMCVNVWLCVVRLQIPNAKCHSIENYNIPDSHWLRQRTTHQAIQNIYTHFGANASEFIELPADFAIVRNIFGTVFYISTGKW